MKSATEVLPSGHQANLYNANENVYVFLDPEFPGTMRDLLTEACFPVEPPENLIGDDRRDYIKAIGRMFFFLIPFTFS